MNTKQRKRQRDIKTKLMAAICMLLVSSIMMVSTTYAWFTLSTAPEVTGINTAVGANGNLEMALLPKDGQLNTISTGHANSVKADLERNVTWGNLVDVSDSAYGLDKITLYPSALNIGGDGKLPTTGALLQTPAYGADGRVAQLQPNTLTSGTFNTQSSSFTPDNVFGVRAVGTASGMTDRQLSYRNARAAANTAVSMATKNASDSLSNNGSALANLAIKKGTGNNTFTQADFAALESIVEDLETSVLPQIETAYMQYILGYAASAETGGEDTVWLAVKALVDASDATLESVRTSLAGKGVNLDGTALDTAMKDYYDIVDAVDTAKTNLTSAKKEGTEATYTWDELRPILTALANPETMLVNDIPAGEIMDRVDELASSLMGGKGLVVSMASGGGVYADIADQCGDFTAGVQIEHVEFKGLVLNEMSAKMNTKSDVKPSHLAQVGTAVETAGAPAGGGAGDVPITDMFGYVIDMAFRTNAADSNLLLQPEGVDRIYSDNKNGVETDNGETTMGGGAYMQFVSTTNSFGNDKVSKLMEAIRIVFFDPDSGEIIAYGKLNTADAENTADGGLKAKIVLYTVTTGDTYVAANGAEATHVAVTTTTYEPKGDRPGTHTEAGAPAEGDEATHVAVTTTTYEIKGDREGTHKLVSGNTEVIKTDNVIMPLNQNQAHKLSVLVYLDGNKVTNAEVAATASTSVTGTMNLQFSSSATLVPMNYTPLMEQGGAATPETTETQAQNP